MISKVVLLLLTELDVSQKTDSNAKLVGLQTDTANPKIKQLPRDTEAITIHMC